MKDSLFLQVKILLNLCRCLLKLADVDNTRGHAIWAKQAIKGCSIGLTLCEYHATESTDEKTTLELTSLIEKARIVRARSFIRSSKVSLLKDYSPSSLSWIVIVPVLPSTVTSMPVFNTLFITILLTAGF